MTRSASERQVQAAEPAFSTWLSANAGSGKTRVLTDRVARLLLGGVEPQHILCLTYTKAAATEMQNRLFKRLGEWAMKPDPALQAALAELGEGARITPETLAQARRLFARAIETPGGLRIQTIHSFCASLLRRFPLEAGVSPQFTELDDRTARLLRDEIVEELADTLAPDLIADLARAWTGDEFGDLVQQIVGNRSRFSAPMTAEAARRLFGLKQGETVDTLLSDTFLGDEATWMPDVITALRAKGGNDEKAAAKLAQIDFASPSLSILKTLEGIFLFGADAKKNEPFSAKTDSFPTKDTRAAIGPLLPKLQDLMLRVESARTTRCALNAMDRTLTLHRFAAAFLPLYEQRKAQRGWLDFDDLITRASTLLNDQSVAAWVLFRLDGGIDHILVDEAQDTSPEQWRVIESLAAEFTAGSGARDIDRTLFVVGDKKQSIYSFQGADVAAFDAKQTTFRSKFEAVQRAFQSLELEHSFRSSPAILRVVDETFGDRFPAALGGKSSHIAHWETMPGRVDLWPLIEKANGKDEDDWRNPVDLITEEHHTARLAMRIADEIHDLIASGTAIPDKGATRPLHAGDVLILVQRRSELFQEIIRACKARGLPIAGADRLKLGAELAVKDITALLAFLATPEDDLSLAAVLRSPLFGWTESELHALAQPRKGYLWEELRDRAADFGPTHQMLSDLRDQADFLRPYDLIERLLTRHDGRRRLIQRLGAEAEDGIDELLSQALAYERGNVPSLTGFLVWLSTDEVEVKRQTDSEGHRIRVMTVHGSKGLEAPIVILPDTCDRTSRDRDEVVDLDGTPVWRTPTDESPAAITVARAARQQREAEERLRLLYVALTRARSWLIICGAGDANKEDAWYRLVEHGMLAAGTEALPGGILRHSFGEWPAPMTRAAEMRVLPPLPSFATSPAITPPRPAQPLSPSNLGGAKAIPGDGLDEDAAKARGSALHLLLEHLPTAPPTDRAALAATLIPDDALQADVLPEALHTIAAHPALFTSLALTEVEVTAELLGRTMRGTIDRLIVSPDRILAIDYKTNRVIPARPEDTPEGILRQMGAYAHALAQIYPGRRIDTALLWTRQAQLMTLPPDIVSAALSRTTIP
jgi:ATP-dependent helicase/nuclease subunit A